ncbi:CBS domain-containing protein [Pontiella sulfatireligans]|uniref:Uncharacterized protein n=1 Tax=Pontiella sulfatireligans TaxID=2750658 RepID=A0A6C2UIJ6_9BACT|nr:hypothetical protein [Pontiella sulfatireligans]VGO19779.1 hypothetical protein SCARR_01838 [Pontiella sulfatireligans]
MHKNETSDRDDMEVQKKKKRIVASSAALMSIAIHVVLILAAGSMVALKYYKKKSAGFQIEEQKPKLERRKLQMPVKAQPFIEQMSKPKMQTTSRITANAPQMVNIPEQGEYLKMAPMPTFKGGYTNFVQMDRSLEFSAKYRDVSFGVSAVDFFGTKGKAEKIAIVVDTSKAMLYDERGGAESYSMVHEDLHEVIGNMRSATLFNVVLYDGSQVALFNQGMVPATPAAKTNVLEWIGGINTNLAKVGLLDGMANYAPKKAYDVPMEQRDVTGWLKGLQAAVELNPEIIFLLSSDWGNVTTMEEGISYFLNTSVFEEYQQKRAAYFLEEEDAKEDMDLYRAEFDQMRAIALKMLELENQARIDAEMQPKVVRDWDEILLNNEVELPELPLVADQEEVGASPAQTRYTIDEVLETIFVMVMDNYRQKGFPQLNFVMLTGEGFSRNSTAAASMMTSDAKFQNLTKMVKGRFRYLEGMPAVDNLLMQDADDVLQLIESEETEEL